MKEAWFNVDRELMRRDLYLGTFAPTPRTQLDELAAEYHERCEAYDRLVCTGPIKHGSIMPATTRELHLIGRHARDVRHELTKRAELAGYTSQQLTKAINNHA
ncbi:hypothetical protein KNT66_gp14 [Burkholderia phage FLC5]|uniref:Uncharacterized protein n=1 Tax=Burkholderia phage FLC5 TaxID=2716322 RepID=A0A7G1GLY5_9CAUD|nr:hypothetical protein KNT66_gp14 [Burkholderia phage FLC5]BCB23186.1 hypothetical protein [Burkholderia phage FLC5]